MTDEKRITVRSKPLPVVDGDGQGTKAIDVAICTKQGMEVRVRGNDMAIPDADCYFYIKLEHPWKRPDGSTDYDEIITNGDDFFIAFRSLGKQRLKWTAAVRDITIQAVHAFVEELNK